MTEDNEDDGFEPVESGNQFWKPEDEGMTLRGKIVEYDAANNPSDNDVFTIEATEEQEITVSDGDEGYEAKTLEEGELINVSAATLEEPLNSVRNTDTELEVRIEFVEMRKSANGFPYRDYRVSQREL